MEETADVAVAAADGETQRLDPRWVAYRRMVGWVFSAGVALGLAAAAAILVVSGNLEPWPAGLLVVSIAAATAGHGQWWPGVQYRYARYRLGRRALEIRRGVLWRSVIDVPRSRIQHSDVSQGPIERHYSLGTLSVYTAGTRYALVRLNGLAHERALQIREHLLQADEDDVI
jgi:uncharacterized protein